ncbi:MAG: hypothetical protein AAFX01_01215 [Cyanobacteria bacterium J06638_28]
MAESIIAAARTPPVMRTPRLIATLLVVCVLAAFILQNGSPGLNLVFLGFRSVALPFSFWLGSAIALGALTTLGISQLLGSTPATGSRDRRRWQVKPDAGATARDTHNPYDPPRRPNNRRSTPPPQTGQRPPVNRSPATPANWQTWENRNPASRWEDWSQANSPDPADANFSKRQRQDQEKAKSTLNDMTQGWDETAKDTVYVAPGGSKVEDTLDDIADGWDDWETEQPPAQTAYAYGHQDRESRVDAVYGPPDDQLPRYQDWYVAPDDGDSDEDWGLDIEAGSETSPTPESAASNEAETGDGVYDADYRVIIPPQQPFDKNTDNNADDRSP